MAAAAAQAAQPAGVVEYGEPDEQKWRAIQPAAWTGSAAQQFWDYCNCVPFIIRKRCETEAGSWDVFKCWLCNVEVTDSHLRSPKHARRLTGLSAWMLPYLPPDAALLQTFGSWDCPWPGHPRPTGGAGAAPAAPAPLAGPGAAGIVRTTPAVVQRDRPALADPQILELPHCPGEVVLRETSDSELSRYARHQQNLYDKNLFNPYGDPRAGHAQPPLRSRQPLWL